MIAASRSTLLRSRRCWRDENGQFVLIVRAYVPTQAILDGSYKLPNVERAK